MIPMRLISAAAILAVAGWTGNPPAQVPPPASEGIAAVLFDAFPAWGSPGSLVSLRGAGLGSADSVQLGTLAVPFSRQSDDVLLVQVPPAARQGRWRVRVGSEWKEGSGFLPAPLPGASGQWRTLGSLKAPHHRGASAVLPDGQIFVAGGLVDQDSLVPTDLAELYDPKSGRTTWSGRLPAPRLGFTCTVLRDGRLLLAGGTTTALLDDPSASALIFDPARKAFSPTGSLLKSRTEHAALLLPSGKVLIAGGTGMGWGTSQSDPSARIATELFDPSTGAFQAGPGLQEARQNPALLQLPDGRVLVAGGRRREEGTLRTVELLDLQAATSRTCAKLDIVGLPLALSLQPDGKVLAAGASRVLLLREGPVPSVEDLGRMQLLDPRTGTVGPPSPPHNRTWWQGAGLALPDGGLMIAGNGQRPSGSRLDRFDPRSGAFVRGAEMGRALAQASLLLLPDGGVVALGGLDIRPFPRPTEMVQILR